MGDEPKIPNGPLQSFVDVAHPLTEEERNRPRLGRPVRGVGADGLPLPAFPAVVVTRKGGAEPFHGSGTPLAFNLLSFWQWAASDVTNNALRGLIAEYLVAQALGAADGVRVEWDRCDLKSPCGANVEVKSAAYFQSWAQTKLSDIEFSIAPTFGWDAVAGAYEPAARRQADVYVFALLHHRDKPTLDPLNVNQWMFFVLGTAALNTAVPDQRTIRYSRLLALKPAEATYATLRETIERVVTERMKA